MSPTPHYTDNIAPTTCAFWFSLVVGCHHHSIPTNIHITSIDQTIGSSIAVIVNQGAEEPSSSWWPAAAFVSFPTEPSESRSCMAPFVSWFFPC